MIKGHILEQEGDNRKNASCIMDMHICLITYLKCLSMIPFINHSFVKIRGLKIKYRKRNIV